MLPWGVSHKGNVFSVYTANTPITPKCSTGRDIAQRPGFPSESQKGQEAERSQTECNSGDRQQGVRLFIPRYLPPSHHFSRNDPAVIPIIHGAANHMCQISAGKCHSVFSHCSTKIATRPSSRERDVLSTNSIFSYYSVCDPAYLSTPIRGNI